MECEDLAASIGLLSDCEKVVPSKVVVDKDGEMLMLVFDEALCVGDGETNMFSILVLILNITQVFNQYISACIDICYLSNPECYGSLLTLDELKEFDMPSDDYEINWHLRSVINPTSKDLKSRSAKVKNRRRAFMNKLMNGGKLFSKDSIRDREPYLHHEFVGKFHDQSGRQMYRPVEKWNKKRRKMRMTRKWKKGSMAMPMCVRNTSTQWLVSLFLVSVPS
nr:hypothetical protein [Tanacetum cinerariifolium]